MTTDRAGSTTLPLEGCSTTVIQGERSKDMTTPNLSNLLVAGQLNDRYRDAASERLVHPRPLPKAARSRPATGIRVLVRRRFGWLSSSI
jgi:hypothetical protein